MQIRDPDSVESDASEAIPSGMAAPAPAPTYKGSVPGIAALSDDPLLLEALTGAVGDGSAVSSSPSSDRFIDQVVANGGGVVFIDAASVTGSLRAFVIMLREQFPQLVLLVAGSAQAQGQIAGQIADGTVFRFVHKPASSQRLRLFLEAAARRQAGATTAELRALTPPEGSAPATPSSAGQRPLIIGGIALGVLAATAIAWALMHGHSPTPTPAETGSPAGGDAVAPARIENPAPAAAPAETPPPVAQDNPPRETAGPAGGTRDAALEAAQRTAQGARADQLALYLQLARKRIASGALVQPADDNALTYLNSAKALAPGDPDVRATSVAMGEALLGQFHNAIEARDPVQARHWLAAASDFHIGAALLTQLGNQLSQLEASLPQHPAASESAPVRDSAPPVAAPPAAAPAVSAAATPLAPAVSAAPVAAPPAPAAASTVAPTAVPPPASAPAAAPGEAEDVVSESALKRVSFVAPSYPRDALERNISGWVDLEFTVTPEGRVTDVQVTAAEPHNTFERVARLALQSCRYQPVIRNGVPVAQRARMRVRFKP